jgi:hypothetical protein
MTEQMRRLLSKAGEITSFDSWCGEYAVFQTHNGTVAFTDREIMRMYHEVSRVEMKPYFFKGLCEALLSVGNPPSESTASTPEQGTTAPDLEAVPVPA